MLRIVKGDTQVGAVFEPILPVTVLEFDREREKKNSCLNTLVCYTMDCHEVVNVS